MKMNWRNTTMHLGTTSCSLDKSTQLGVDLSGSEAGGLELQSHLVMDVICFVFLLKNMWHQRQLKKSLSRKPLHVYMINFAFCLSIQHRTKFCSHPCTATTNQAWYDPASQIFYSVFRICRQNRRETLRESILPFPQCRIVSLVPNTNLWWGTRLNSLMPPPPTICSCIPYICYIHSLTMTCFLFCCSTPNSCLYPSCFPKCCQFFLLSPGWQEMAHERLSLTAE